MAICPVHFHPFHSSHPRDRYMEDRGRFVSQMGSEEGQCDDQMQRKDDV